MRKARFLNGSFSIGDEKTIPKLEPKYAGKSDTFAVRFIKSSGAAMLFEFYLIKKHKFS